MTNPKLAHQLRIIGRARSRAPITSDQIARALAERPGPFTGFIYVIRGLRSGMLKVGRTKNIAQRMTALKVANGEPLELVGVIPSADHETLESYLHGLLGPYRSHGEWFFPECGIISAGRGHLRSEDEVRAMIFAQMVDRLAEHDGGRSQEIVPGGNYDIKIGTDRSGEPVVDMKLRGFSSDVLAISQPYVSPHKSKRKNGALARYKAARGLV